MKQSTIFLQAPDTAPPTYPPTAVLTTAQVAAWLQVHPRQIARMGVPPLKLGHKTVRYRVRDVQAWLDRQAAKKVRRS